MAVGAFVKFVYSIIGAFLLFILYIYCMVHSICWTGISVSNYSLCVLFYRWIVKQAFSNVTILNVSSKHTSVMGRMTALMALMRMPDMHVDLHLSGIRMCIWLMWYEILTVVAVKIIVFQKLKSCLKGVCSELLEEPAALVCRLEADNSRFLQNTCIYQPNYMM